MGPSAELSRIACYEEERRGIFIHRDLLQGTPFGPGDRFAILPRPAQLFSVTLVRDPAGPILFDRHGIFLERTRRLDILLGGIFERYAVLLDPARPDTLRLRPLEALHDPGQAWF